MARVHQQRSVALLGIGAVGLAAVAVAAVGYVYSKRRPRSGFTIQQWIDAQTEAGSIRDFEQIAAEVVQRGLEPAARAEVWPFLLGVFSPESSLQERELLHEQLTRRHQQLILQCQALEAALQQSVASSNSGSRPGVVGALEGDTDANGSDAVSVGASAADAEAAQQLPEQVIQFAEAHRIMVIDAVRTDFRRHAVAAIDGGVTGPGVGGIVDAVNSVARQLQAGPWLDGLLGGLQQPVQADTADGSSPFQQPWRRQLPSQPLWVSSATQQTLDSSPHLSTESRRQAARLVALLSTYAVHDPETGYCQGMSDLALPFLVLLDDDVTAFWCFEALMHRMGARRNFAVDESGIWAQLRRLGRVLSAADSVLDHKLRMLGASELHFAYRMIVVLMRRDLPLGQAMVLWEMLWADQWAQLHRRALSGQPGGDSLDAADEAVEDLLPSMRDQACLAVSHGAQGQDGVLRLPTGGDADRSDGLLFTYFVAQVILSQRRRVIDECHDPDDVLRLFHTHKVDVWDCMSRAQHLRARLEIQQ